MLCIKSILFLFRGLANLLVPQVLAVLPFDSSRKCMSIIVIHPRTMQVMIKDESNESKTKQPFDSPFLKTTQSTSDNPSPTCNKSD